MSSVQILGVSNLPEIRPGDPLVEFLAQCEPPLEPGDILVVTQKVVSKAEGRLFRIADVQASERAMKTAQRWDKEPGLVELVLRETQELLRETNGVLISRTHQGFVCANAGIDLSNVDGGETACLLPVDCDGSARELYKGLELSLGFPVPVLISDSFGRPWRAGITNVALGSFGLDTLIDHRGTFDSHGMEMKATIIGIADALAAATELVVGKTTGYGACIIRGYEYTASQTANVAQTIRPWEQCFFT